MAFRGCRRAMRRPAVANAGAAISEYPRKPQLSGIWASRLTKTHAADEHEPDRAGRDAVHEGPIYQAVDVVQPVAQDRDPDRKWNEHEREVEREEEDFA